MNALPLTLLWLACDGGLGDAADYPAALAEIARQPDDAARICARVEATPLREDCVTAAVEALATTDAQAASALCEGLSPGIGRDECNFQVAEVSGDPARCPAAGAFAENCQMHLWTKHIRELLPEDAAPGDVEGTLETQLALFGFEPGDMRPWSAVYRNVLSKQRPLDRASCARAPTPALVLSCQRTALTVYQDRLNQLRDRGLFQTSNPAAPGWCDGGPLPALATTTPDPELDGMLSQRRHQDLCR